ncbi:curli production assembly/transport component CsgG [Polaribacter sp. Hel1_33_78]|uniref:CsgG/HfaB family protein n=1 Tax=Polaribacter sp. Hel1_33_78 TaxID=1336804 RepID=UPI00087ADC34|nr:CsgG/HfaB family protein [Polaribacter sp. Hel1_33_78]SDT94340.1 curli production assembly/transport component CsgG [Polaribacter sp. Hel1_33_78]
MKITTSIVYLLIISLLTGCGAYFNQPFTQTKARIGENTSPDFLVKKILPSEKIIVGVYKFRDQTGQYKPVENGSTFSAAITQGGTTILLKSLEESGWFRPIERENIGNLLNERQIIRNTRQEYANGKKVTMPPLLFAGTIIEGGVVSYDSNIITGGSGLRYFGAGVSNQYRQDRITVYLRIVSTSTGEILKNVYVSKTILSQGISANLYRFVSLRRLLEAETGVTKNEPSQLAVKEAIDKAVDLLIVEGIADGIWRPKGGEAAIEYVKKAYMKERIDAEKTELYDRKKEKRRAKVSSGFGLGMAQIKGDYVNPTNQFGFDLKIKYSFNDPSFNIWGSVGRLELDNKDIFHEIFLTSGFNIEYIILPYEKFTPYLYAGAGSISKTNLDQSFFKFQGGVGIEYLISNKIGFFVEGEYNMLLSDDLDGRILGEKNDMFSRFGFGLNVYF